MNRLLIILAVICLATISTSSCAPERDAPLEEAPSTEADIEAIKELRREIEAAYREADVVRVGALVTDDVVLMAPGSPVVIGKQAVMSRAEELLEQLTVEETDDTIPEVVVVGDWAYFRLSYSWTFTPKAGGEPFRDIGKGITICKRQPDGSWKAAREIWNSNTTPSG